METYKKGSMTTVNRDDKLTNTSNNVIIQFNEGGEIVFVDELFSTLFSNKCIELFSAENLFEKINRHYKQAKIASLSDIKNALKLQHGLTMPLNGGSTQLHLKIESISKLENKQHYEAKCLILKPVNSNNLIALIDGISTSIPGAFFKLKTLTNGKLIIDYISTGISSVTGFEQDYYYKAEVKYFVHEDDQHKLAQATNHCSGLNQITHLELRTFNSKGKVIWIEVQAKNQLDESSQLILTGSIRDITFRKTVETQLKDSNATMLKFFELSNDAFWDWDLHSDSCYYSKGYEKLFGYSTESPKFHYNNWKTKVHPDDLEKLNSTINSALNNQNGSDYWTLQYRYSNAENRYCNVEAKGLIIRNERGKPSRMIGVVQDVTKLKDSVSENSKLKKKNEELKKKLNKAIEENKIYSHESKVFFELSPLPKFVYCKDSLKVLRVNKAATNLYGYSKKDFLNMDLSQFILPCDEEFKSFINIQALKLGIYNPINIYKHITSSGKNLYVEIHENQINRNHPEQISISVLDITDSVFLKSKINEHTKTLNNLAWFQSHEVRAPLANIMGLTDMITPDMQKHELLEYIDMLKLSASRLDHAVKQVLDLTTYDGDELNNN